MKNIMKFYYQIQLNSSKLAKTNNITPKSKQYVSKIIVDK